MVLLHILLGFGFGSILGLCSVILSFLARKEWVRVAVTLRQLVTKAIAGTVATKM